MNLRTLGIVVLLLLAFLFPLAASEEQSLYHIIGYYSVEVKGKSDAAMIKAMIAPSDGDPPFASEAALLKALEAKKTKLLNMRIFEEVSYSYEAVHADNTAIRYRVKFFVDDAFSFIAIPYPKFDSNYGFKLGLKAYDKNLFGKFADLYFVINAAQIDNSWHDYELYSEISITDIPIGKSSIDLNFDVSAQLHDQLFEDIAWQGKIDWKGIPLNQTSFDFHLVLEEETGSNVEIDRRMTTSFQWENLPWINSVMSIRPEAQFLLNENNEWSADNVSFTFDVNPITINGESYVLAHRSKLKFPHEYLQFTTSLSLVNATLLSLPFSFWVSSDNYLHLEDQQFGDNTYTVGSALSIPLPFKTSYRGSFEFSLREGFNHHSNQIELELVPLLSSTQQLSFGTINWKGNIRNGLKGNLTAKVDYGLFNDGRSRVDSIAYQVQADVEAFIRLGSTFGLSSHILGFYSEMPSSNWYKDQHFPTFLPSRQTKPTGYIRGILDKTYEQVVGSGDYQKLGAVANFDATFLFVKFPKLGEGFISLFSDIGVFTDANTPKNDIQWQDVTIFKTVGIEGYGILNKFPSYPIRASLGLNLDDVISHFNGDIALGEIEYVLTIGMGLHY
ncbi:MAG: hypothetical protein ACOXZ4_02490 [Sphaerochaetaceae bacterium]